MKKLYKVRVPEVHYQEIIVEATSKDEAIAAAKNGLNGAKGGPPGAGALLERWLQTYESAPHKGGVLRLAACEQNRPAVSRPAEAVVV